MNDDPESTEADQVRRLAAWFAGELSSAEAAALDRWARSAPERSALVHEARQVWEATARQRPGWDVGAMSRQLEERIAREGRQDRSTAAPPAPARAAARRGWPARSLAAAAVVLMASGAWSVMQLTNRERSRSGAREIVTARGQRATVELRDGSRVTLGADSRLGIPADFDGVTRTVTLDGEAYFVVAHDASRPFDVRTGFAVTRVLGTRFGVRVDSGRQSVDVVVASGKVALRRVADTAPALELTEGQHARLGRSGAPDVERDAAVDRLLAWTTGELVFDRTPLSDVVRTLERWYDVRVVLDDSSIAARRVTAIVRSDRSPADAVRAIALSLDLEIRQEDAHRFHLRSGTGGHARR